MTSNMEEGLVQLREGFDKLLKILDAGETFSSEDYVTNYSTVVSLASSRENAVRLYDDYRQTLQAHLQGAVVPSLRRFNGRPDEFLQHLVERWQSYSIMLRWLSHLYAYLDRCYLHQLRRVPSVQNIGVACFRDIVFSGLKTEVIQAVVSLVDSDRAGDGTVRCAVLRATTVDLFASMGVAEEEWVGKLLEASAVFYSRAAEERVTLSCPEYMAAAERSLRKESERVRGFLSPAALSNLEERIREALLVPHATRLLHDQELGFRALLRADRTEVLKTIFQLHLSLPEQLASIADLFSGHLSDELSGFVQRASETDESQVDLISRVINLHDVCRATYVEACFANHTAFRKAFAKAFREFGGMTVSGRPTAEILAGYFHALLKKGGVCERLSDEMVESTLDAAVNLLVYVKDKDIFADYHRKKLAHRLLSGRSLASGHETCLVGKLKVEFGLNFTSKMECMMEDVATAKEITQEKFRAFMLRYPEVGVVETTVTVLTTSQWPSYNASRLTFPPEMARAAEAFTVFHSGLFPNRKLTWVHSLGTCHVTARFAAGTVELFVTTYQAAVLTLFNAADVLSADDIRAELGAEREDLARVLHSLSRAGCKILTGKTVSKRKVFEFNSGFDHPTRRIKVAPPHEVPEERRRAAKGVENDRRYHIECAIVRIMKAKKVLTYTKLIGECVKALSLNFEADVKAIKKSIDRLVEREFIERDKDDPNVFNYLP